MAIRSRATLAVCAVVVLAVGVVAVGCGGDTDEGTQAKTPPSGVAGAAESAAADGDASTGGSGEVSSSSEDEGQPSPEKVAFTKEVNAICERGLVKAQNDAADASGSRQEPGAEAFADALPPVFRDVADEIEAVEAPQGDDELVAAFLEALRQGLEEVDENSGSFGSFEELEEPLTPAGELAVAYGISNCGFGS